MGSFRQRRQLASSVIAQSSAMETKLSLLLIAVIASVRGEEPCCYKKDFGGTTYTRIESGSSEAVTAGCDTQGACIYEDSTGKRFCFKRGGAEVPTNCKGVCDGVDLIVTNPMGEGTLTAHVLPEDAACQKLPTILSSASDSTKLYQCNSRLYTQQRNSKNQYELFVLEDSTKWSLVEKHPDMPSTPPYALDTIAVSNNKLYIFGGMKEIEGATLGVDQLWALDCVKHAKGENNGGTAWNKPGSQPPEGFFRSIACVGGNYLAVAGGVKKIDGGKYYINRDIHILDLTKTGKSSTKVSTADTPQELACKGDKVYLKFEDSDDNCMTKEINMAENAPKLVDHGTAPGQNHDCYTTSLMVRGGEVTMMVAGDANLHVLADDGTWKTGQPFSSTLTEQIAGIITPNVLYL